MIADLFVIKETGKYGKGLFATRFIPKGTIIYFLCRRDRPWTKRELAKLSKERLKQVMEQEYPIKNCDERPGYINHSCNPRIMETDKGFDIVVRNIKKGEEATEDYRIFVSDYSVNRKYFVGGCKCGAKNCMKKEIFKHPPSKKLQKFWSLRIKRALRSIPYVKQPLKKQLLKEHPELSYLFKKSR